MNKEQYRQHMMTYARETAVMSYTVADHPDYVALNLAGREIIPFLLQDMLDPDWHCVPCMGFGYEFVATWRDEAWPPRSSGRLCPKCGGKGNISSWACVSLLHGKAGEDAPKVENRMRGKHAMIVKLWQKWGEKRGYLPPTPEPEGIGMQVVRALKDVIGWKS